MSTFDGNATDAAAWPNIPLYGTDCVALGGWASDFNAPLHFIVQRLNFLKQNAGSKIFSGPDVPLNPVGVEGDYFIDTTTAMLYGPKAHISDISQPGQGNSESGAWVSPTSPISLRGTGGSAFLNGTAAPDNTLGANGDFYLDTAALAIYGPKNAGAWPAGVSLRGEAGPVGSGAMTRVAVFDAAGNFTFNVPAGVTTLEIDAWGPGGGGSRMAAPDGSGNYYKGGGGGGGSYIKAIVPVTPGQQVLGNVGAKGVGAGVGSQAASDNGADGTPTHVNVTGGWFLNANGGAGATGVTTGGTGGLPSAGNGATVVESVEGQHGQESLLVLSNSGVNPPYYSGAGGQGAKGGAGGPGRRSISNSSGDIAPAGVFPGGGGAGADELGLGGPGADGKVVIRY